MLSCSISGRVNETGQLVYEFNDDGPVYGPTGEWELDPDNNQCDWSRPVFATCKNNCPGGELSVISSEIFFINYKIENTNITEAD